jgi:uncharacterized membrane protein YdbT with pleckstrin-like domain
MPETTTPTPEIPVWKGHPSHWHYFWMWFFGILLIVAVVGLLMIGWIYLDRARRTYIVTRTKIIVELGLFAKSSNEVRIRDVRSINLNKHGMVGFLGVGDLEFSSSATDKAEIVFNSIAKASEVLALVRQYQGA